MRLGCSGGMIKGANSSGELLLDDSCCEYCGLVVLFHAAWSGWILCGSGEGQVAVLLVGSGYVFVDSNGACRLILLEKLDLRPK